MNHSRFSEEQIRAILAEFAGGRSSAEIARERGISRSLVYLWRKKYGGGGNGVGTAAKTVVGVSGMRLWQLEGENRQLRRIVADQALEIRGLKDLVAKQGNGGTGDGNRD